MGRRTEEEEEFSPALRGRQLCAVLGTPEVRGQQAHEKGRCPVHSLGASFPGGHSEPAAQPVPKCQGRHSDKKENGTEGHPYKKYDSSYNVQMKRSGILGGGAAVEGNNVY